MMRGRDPTRDYAELNWISQDVLAARPGRVVATEAEYDAWPRSTASARVERGARRDRLRDVVGGGRRPVRSDVRRLPRG
jgi:hypothetical protein